jgi:hypothetical protein
MDVPSGWERGNSHLARWNKWKIIILNKLLKII